LPIRVKKLFLNLSVLIASILLCALGLIVFEQAYCHWHKIDPERPPYVSGDKDPLGWQPQIGRKIDHAKVINGKLLYKVSYQIDSRFPRRISPRLNGATVPKQYALFFVDSNAFGEGLSDEETIPTQFGNLLPEFRSYNYAFRGYGPQQMLARLEQGFAKGELLEESGIGFYFYSDSHVARVNGLLPEIAWAGGRHPNYELNSEGKPVWQGSFSDTQPWRSRFLWFIGKSYFVRSRSKYFTPRREDHYKLTCALILQSRERFESMHKDNLFYVVLTQIQPLEEIAYMQRECFEKNKLNIINISFPAGEGRPELTFYPDAHWNHYAASLIAAALIRGIKAPGAVRAQTALSTGFGSNP
jgi:hypothetical protein